MRSTVRLKTKWTLSDAQQRFGGNIDDSIAVARPSVVTVQGSVVPQIVRRCARPTSPIILR